jgi:hypothetical protein
MRFDPEIEIPAIQAAREAGKEKDFSYWRDLYLKTLERRKEEEQTRHFNRIIGWLLGVCAAGIFVAIFVMHR